MIKFLFALWFVWFNKLFPEAGLMKFLLKILLQKINAEILLTMVNKIKKTENKDYIKWYSKIILILSFINN